MTDMDKMMIEKVARAIHVARFDGPRKPAKAWEMDDSDWEYAERLARAAISAYNPNDRLREALEECRLIVANLPHGEKLLLAKIDAALSPLPQGDG